jgi:hypothetical protein
MGRLYILHPTHPNSQLEPAHKEGHCPPVPGHRPGVRANEPSTQTANEPTSRTTRTPQTPGKQASPPSKPERTPGTQDPHHEAHTKHDRRRQTGQRSRRASRKASKGEPANSGQATQERCLCSLLSGGVCAPQALRVRAPGTCCLQRVCNIRPWVRSQALRPMRSMTGPHDVLPSRCY